MSKWQVVWYSEMGEGGEPTSFIIEADNREEAIKKAPHDPRDPDKYYFSAHKIEEE